MHTLARSQYCANMISYTYLYLYMYEGYIMLRTELPTPLIHVSHIPLFELDSSQDDALMSLYY